jgi:ABC-2 type transport system permease protein
LTGARRPGWFGEHAMLMAVLWPVVITALTLPLAVRTFQRLSR